MKTTRYQFERDIEGADSSKADWLKQAYKSILESDKHFTAKADYIGFSILSIDEKVQSLDEQIKELQAVKKRLKEAKEVAVTIGAEIFTEYGIDKLEGTGISSITITDIKQSFHQELLIFNEAALINEGYFKVILDTEAIINDFTKADVRAIIEPYCNVIITTTSTLAKLKINKRRSANTTDFTAVESNMEVA